MQLHTLCTLHTVSHSPALSSCAVTVLLDYVQETPDLYDDDAFYLFLQKQKRAYGHIPILWILPHTEKKRGTCDDASTITLVVQWWFFVPFGTRDRVLYSLSGNHPQCPFIQMTDTDVTFLSCYNTVGHARVYVMALTSPPSLLLSRLWAELSV
jgi:hypothetical protein